MFRAVPGAVVRAETAARQHGIAACSFHINPYVARFNPKPTKSFPKQTTGLAGLNVVEHPHRALSVVYGRILRTLQKVPEDAAYRRYTEQIVRQRLQHVQSEADVAKLEEKIGMGQVEELLQQAEYELRCARVMIKHRVWEPLVAPAPLDQWKWPV